MTTTGIDFKRRTLFFIFQPVTGLYKTARKKPWEVLLQFIAIKQFENGVQEIEIVKGKTLHVCSDRQEHLYRCFRKSDMKVCTGGAIYLTEKNNEQEGLHSHEWHGVGW